MQQFSMSITTRQALQLSNLVLREGDWVQFDFSNARMLKVFGCWGA